jgi:hypothetical protein
MYPKLQSKKKKFKIQLSMYTQGGAIKMVLGNNYITKPCPYAVKVRKRSHQRPKMPVKKFEGRGNEVSDAFNHTRMGVFMKKPLIL